MKPVEQLDSSSASHASSRSPPRISSSLTIASSASMSSPDLHSAFNSSPTVKPVHCLAGSAFSMTSQPPQPDNNQGSDDDIMGESEHHSSASNFRYTVKLTAGKQTVVIQKEEAPIAPTLIPTLTAVAPSKATNHISSVSANNVASSVVAKDTTAAPTLRESNSSANLSDSTPLATPVALKTAATSQRIVSPPDSSAPHSSALFSTTRESGRNSKDFLLAHSSYQADGGIRDNLVGREGAILCTPQAGGAGKLHSSPGGSVPAEASVPKESKDSTSEPKSSLQSVGGAKANRDPTAESRIASADERRLLDSFLDSNARHVKPIIIRGPTKATRNINVIWGASSVVQLSPSVNSGAGFYPDPDSDSDSDSAMAGRGPIF